MAEGLPILTLLGAIAATRPDLVLMQGRKWFRIEALIKQARRDAKQSEDARAALEAPIYTEGKDKDGKLVIWREATGGRKATFVEPGSNIQTDP
jgi:hypothetical protein